jgi:hypothetical protein
MQVARQSRFHGILEKSLPATFKGGFRWFQGLGEPLGVNLFPYRACIRRLFLLALSLPL